MTDPNYNLIIIGAGAAGFMAAISAGKRGLSVLLIDHSKKIGEKIRISGGGRCNFTNIYASAENYISNNPHFCKSALANFTPQDFLALVEKYKIPYHEKKLGQLFCDGKSTEIIDMLYREAKLSKVTIVNDYQVQEIKEGFTVVSNQGEFNAPSLAIATGGLSIPQIGATDLAYRVAKQFGLNIIEPSPALVSFTCKEIIFRDLAGLSFDAQVTLGKRSFRENILFTHKGLSGPAILQISSYWKQGDTININLCPDLDLKKYLLENKKQEKRKLKNILKEIKFKAGQAEYAKINRGTIFPDNFVDHLASEYDLEKPLAEYANETLEKISSRLQSWQVKPTGTEGYAKAEVTTGGVDTNELNSKTMESKKVPGLYFIGECVDVTGWLGGYNFQWAWASGYACGNSILHVGSL